MSGVEDKLAAVERLIAAGDNTRALAQCRRLAQQAPAHAGVAAAMSAIHYNLAQLPRAIHYAGVLAALRPTDAAARRNLAGLLIAERRWGEAMEAIDAAEVLAPGDPGVAHLAATCLAEWGRPVAALARVEAARAAGRASPPLLSVGGLCLLNLGRVEEAVEMLRLALGADPDNPAVASQLALAMNYVPGVDAGEVLAAHRAYGAMLDRLSRPWEGPRRAPGQRPRVGLVSPDLRTHSVAFFLMPWLRHRDRTRADVVAYFTNRHADGMTGAMRGLCARWRDMGNVSDGALAGAIARDGVDVLVDLSGHTAGHSLGAFHLRPAAVQATYLGYPNTTGVSAVGWRIVDSITDPPGEADGACVERLARLDPCFLCFEPPGAAPDVAPPPSTRRGGVTFGSFNAGAKINDAVLGLWARVLGRVPGSRLMLKAPQYEEPEARAQVSARFARAGGDPAVLTVCPPDAGQGAHLARYAEVDIALDPFPYHGTTTTCEALWMGVPVVTLAGRSHASRVGVSLLSAVGLPEFVAGSAGEYESIAAGLAGDGGRLAYLRGSLRERVRGSILCDGPGFARRLDGLLGALGAGVAS